jgi:uncharacterized protein (TIGR02284 family)
MILSTSATHIVNDMLQGEIAATETYQQALAQVGNEPGADDLRRHHVEHREAANWLRQYVRELGGQPSQSSQTWGVVAKAVQGVAKLFGNTAALKALKVGEERGAATYEEALTNEHLPKEFIDFVRTTLLPQTQAHVHVLDRILQSAN